jgi:hypothetical protein
MESFSSNTLTILVIIGIISSGLAFTSVSILIIYLLCIKNRRSDIVSPVYTNSIVSSDSYDGRSSSVSSSVSSIPVKSPVITSTKREEQQPSRLQKYRSNSISIIDENPSDDQKKNQQVYKRNGNDETTIRSESRIYTQHYQQRRQQQPVKPRTDIQLIDRTTPYPPDVIARDRVMMTYFRSPIDGKHNK